MSKLEQFTVDVIRVKNGGFGPDMHKVRVTDTATGLFEECDEERSQHRNCEIAKQRLIRRLESVSGFNPKVVIKDDCEPTTTQIMELWESVLNDNKYNRSVRCIVLNFAYLLLKKAREE